MLNDAVTDLSDRRASRATRAAAVRSSRELGPWPADPAAMCDEPATAAVRRRGAPVVAA